MRDIETEVLEDIRLELDRSAEDLTQSPARDRLVRATGKLEALIESRHRRKDSIDEVLEPFRKLFRPPPS